MITSSGSKIGLKQKIIAKLKRAFPNDTFFISSFPNAYTATKLQAALARAQACHEAAKELQEQADGKRGGELGKFKRMAKFVVDVEGHPDAVAQLDDESVEMLVSWTRRSPERRDPECDLLTSFKYSQIAMIIEQAKAQEYSSSSVRQTLSQKMALQQVLCAATALMSFHCREMIVGEHYHFLTNYAKLREEITQIRDSNRKLTGIETKLDYIYSDEKKDRDETKREFKWLRRRRHRKMPLRN